MLLVGAVHTALILLPACGGGSDCNPVGDPRAVMFSVPTLADEGNFYGITSYVCDSPTVVRISRETPHELVPRVVAHEMLHCAGLVDHEASPSCYLFKDAFVGQPLDPCTAEVERLAEITGTFTIRVQDPALLDFAIGSAEMWNREADREVFVIIDETPPEPPPTDE